MFIRSQILIVLTSIVTWFEFSSCHTEQKPHTLLQNNQAQTSTVPAFDGARAYKLCAEQVAFGSRVPNTVAHQNCLSFISKELSKYADTVFTQNFSQVVYGTSWNLSNIVAQFDVKNQNRILLCAHWDCRPRSDEDTIKINFSKGIPGANDAASGVAVLLELARVIHESKPEIGVDLVFFDGEDIGYRTDADNFCIGSKYFAKNYPIRVKPRYAVLLDLVGDKEAKFMREQGSVESAFPLVERIWSIGKTHAPEFFSDKPGGAITDDHRSLIEIGIPSVDLIDMELIGNSAVNPRRRYWHTQNDDMNNIGTETLGAVGTVLTQLIYSNPFIM